MKSHRIAGECLPGLPPASSAAAYPGIQSTCIRTKVFCLWAESEFMPSHTGTDLI